MIAAETYGSGRRNRFNCCVGYGRAERNCGRDEKVKDYDDQDVIEQIEQFVRLEQGSAAFDSEAARGIVARDLRFFVVPVDIARPVTVTCTRLQNVSIL